MRKMKMEKLKLKLKKTKNKPNLIIYFYFHLVTFPFCYLLQNSHQSNKYDWPILAHNIAVSMPICRFFVLFLFFFHLSDWKIIVLILNERVIDVKNHAHLNKRIRPIRTDAHNTHISRTLDSAQISDFRRRSNRPTVVSATTGS